MTACTCVVHHTTTAKGGRSHCGSRLSVLHDSFLFPCCDKEGKQYYRDCQSKSSIFYTAAALQGRSLEAFGQCLTYFNQMTGEDTENNKRRESLFQS